jgi:radical SAM protein with 4Fe4S-binding SPASM domain
MRMGVLSSLYYDVPRKLLQGRALPCRNVVFELTYRCNLSCKMCSIMNEIANREHLRRETELDKDEILEIIKQLPPGSNITFTGGEALLKKGIDEILEKTGRSYKITIASNGALLKQHADLLVKAGVRALGVSLDGPPDVHERIRNQGGLFQRLQNGLQALIEAKRINRSPLPAININAVILRENYNTLPQVLKIVKDLGLNSCTFQIFDPSLRRSGIAPDENLNDEESPLGNVEEIDADSLRTCLNEIIEEGEMQQVSVAFSPPLSVDEIVSYYGRIFDLGGWRCHFPWQTTRVSPYGDVYPCLNYRIGNAREHALKDLWNHERYIRFRRTLAKKGIFSACIGCCKMFPVRENRR